MSELPSAMFLIADGNEFRFARFYIVCEEVPLGTPESPPIVSGVPDMHPSDCPNVEETRNPMQTFSRKKCSHFSPTNIPSAFPHEIPKCVSCNITYQTKARYASCDTPLYLYLYTMFFCYALYTFAVKRRDEALFCRLPLLNKSLLYPQSDRIIDDLLIFLVRDFPVQLRVGADIF